MMLQRRRTDKPASLGTKIANTIVGAILIVGGSLGCRVALLKEQHHQVYFFGAIALLGAFLLRPEPLFNIVKRLAGVAAPFVPGTQARAQRLSSEQDRQR